MKDWTKWVALIFVALGSTMMWAGVAGYGPRAEGSPNYLPVQFTAQRFVATAASGTNALSMLTGARLDFGPGATDHLTGNGTDRITAAKDFYVAGDASIGTGGSGDLIINRQVTFANYTDDSANAGNRTVNKIRGRNAVAAGAATVTITNSFVVAGSHVHATLITNDATAVLKNVVPASGSFVLNLTANATGNTVFDWVILSQ